MSNIKIKNNISLIKPIEILKDDLKKQTRKKIQKYNEEDIEIPNFSDYELFITRNYSIKCLKKICKYYKQKVSGNKDELMTRIYIFLKKSFFAIKIQRFWRKYVLKVYIDLRGPAFNNRKICINEIDFYTMERISDISDNQFFSFKDSDNIIYGFDILSLYNLIKKSYGLARNPYNRNLIPSNVKKDIDNLLKISNFIGEKIVIKIEEIEEMSMEKKIELRTISVFQYIDSLGNYTDFNWFMNLEPFGIIRFIRELEDIWTYRAQLSIETKREIYPPNGDPFRGIYLNRLITLPSLSIRKIAIKLIEKLVKSGINESSKLLASNFVLCALTLVSNDAALALPWLYESVAPQ